jgi:hypothetical protein
MANKKLDGVVEAVHYAPDGQVEWVRVYLRRGAAWSDRIILSRQKLIDEIKAGRQIMVGQRVKYMAGTFDTGEAVRVVQKDGLEYLSTASTTENSDQLNDVPVL